MVRFICTFLLVLLTAGSLRAEVPAQTPPAATAPATVASPAAPATRKQVVVIPVREQIATPILYILRRGLKEAIEQKADLVILDMKTPGGALDVTFEIMEALDKFPGQTITYVNTEAISAGAFISAITDEIYFTPDGIIGAAAPVLATGGEIDKSMKMKIVSYLKARVRAISEGKGYRGQVISAMIDEDYELKIGDTVIKAKGELLSLTASEASKTYGDPAQPLLAAGIARDLKELLTSKFGADGYTVKSLEVTWSEQLAVWLNAISPILLGLGLLALFIEFKTPGFGIFGISGIILLAVVFLSNFVAGLSGHEPMLVFALGVLLLAVEIFFLPGTVVMALLGIILMLGSLLWSMADIWPNEPLVFSGDLLLVPAQNLLLGLAFAVALFVIIARFLPKDWIWNRLAVGGAVQGSGVAPGVVQELQSLVGREGVAATSLFPSGQVEIDGRRLEARLEVGFAEAGSRVRVIRHTEFNLTVEVIKP
jgi:membrane-bound serine protease (ClpP class)